jgi:hypothetical protein
MNETRYQSDGFVVGVLVAGLIIGALVVGGIIYTRMKKTADTLSVQIATQEFTISDLQQRSQALQSRQASGQGGGSSTTEAYYRGAYMTCHYFMALSGSSKAQAEVACNDTAESEYTYNWHKEEGVPGWDYDKWLAR